MHDGDTRRIRFDPVTAKWFGSHLLEETTLARCEDCGLYYKPELGHNCKHKKAPTMKSPDEIKKGLECCNDDHCLVCPYQGWMCRGNMETDALAYIQQLEAANNELLTKIEQLTAKCHQLEQERDAAVADIPRACGYCKWFEINLGSNRTECHNPNGCRNISGINTGWEWRGVKEE